jgi:hypothetical protein
MSCPNLTNVALEDYSAVRLLEIGPEKFEISQLLSDEDAAVLRRPIRLTLLGGCRPSWREAMTLASRCDDKSRAELYPGLSRITHLGLLHPSCKAMQDLPIELFPCLTHLAFPFDYFERPDDFDDDLKSLCQRGPGLTDVVVITWAETRLIGHMSDLKLSDERVKNILAIDSRIRLVERSIVDRRNEWEDEARSGCDVWSASPECRR